MEDGSTFTASVTGSAGVVSDHGRDRRAKRRRDRHGRGLRSPLLPAALPGARTRAERFVQYVAESADRLQALWGAPLEAVQFEVEDIPPGLEELAAAGERIPLGDTVHRPGEDPRIVIYRHPVQAAAKARGDTAELIHDVVIEQAALLLGMAPESVDPLYGR